MTTAKKFLSVLFTGALASTAAAAEYYVATSGDDNNDGLSEAPFATVDKAIITATSSDDVIHVAPGTYETGGYASQDDNAKWGPNLRAKLIGTGTSRDAVVIKSDGTYRTLRMAAGSWLENVTVVGEGTYQADKGGAIEMSGGTVTNCVIRGGTAKANGNVAGGNLYVNSNDALVTDCEIYGGTTHKRGGNVYLDHGLVCNCVIHDGVCDDNIGGNVYIYQGTVSNCVIYAGRALNDGGNVRMNGSGMMVDCVISNGVITSESSASKKGANVYMDSTAKMSRCRLVGGSHSGGYNGGSLAIGTATAITEDCLIEGSECGGVLFVGTSYLYNCTVVNNDKYGVWAWNHSAHVFNTVIYGNTEDGNNKDWTGNMPNDTSAEFLNNAVTASGSRHSKTDYPTVVLLYDTSAFADYEDGDYTPASADLIDSGAADPRGASASSLDLAGEPRLSGTVDIGCYEYQKTTMSVDIALADSAETVYAPGSVTFNVTATGYPAGQTPTFTVNFGDGSAEVETTDTQVVHEFTTAGKFTVTVQASAAGAFDAQGQLSSFVQIASKTIYVKAGNESPTFPYNTPETGYATVQAAYANVVDGSEIIVGAGTYDFSGQLSVTKAVAVRGASANPEDVVFQNTKTKLDDGDSYQYRVLEVNNAGARIENITIQNGRVQDQYGANLRLVSGVVSNCVIRGGIASVDNANAAGGGVEIAGEATLTHCVISNNVVNGTSDNSGYTGGAVFIAWNIKNARISNCLIAYNRYKTSGDTPKAGAAGIHFGGRNDNTQIENNTVVANTVEGSLEDDSAGIHCTTWYGRLRNNIVLGNYETGKGKFTAVKMDTEHGTYVGNITEAEADHVSVFRDFANGDFGIKPFSAAYGAGTIAGRVLAPSVDLAGAPRVQFDRIDAGCYECQVRRGVCFIVK